MILPDGPKTPSWFQLFQWISNPLDYMDSCGKQYGDIFTVNLGRVFSKGVFVSHPQAIQEIFTADPKLFDSGRGNKIVQFMVGDTSILLLDGERHQRQRKLLMPPFHGERMKAYSSLIVSLTEEISSQWQMGQPFCMRDAMQEITLRVILQAVFGLSKGSRYDQIKTRLAAMLNMIGTPLRATFMFLPFLQKDLGPWSPWGYVLQLIRQIDELLYAEIGECRQDPDPSRTDILSLMMSAQDEQGQEMTDQELRDELMTLLLAGHETTATALSWAFYWVQKLPLVRERLLQELDSLENNLDLNEMVRLPYLAAVCQESLRLYPVLFITFPRILNAPWQLMGYEFEAGTLLAPCVYLTHHREDIYPEPKQFKPERFLERQFSPYEYFPFGGGTRRCIGAALASLEMKLVLGTLLSRYHLALADSKPVKPQRRGLTLGPSGGVKMVMTGRRVQSNPVPLSTASLGL